MQIPRRAEDLNLAFFQKLAEEVNRANNLSGGPGVQILRSAAGTGIFIVARGGAEGNARKENFTGGVLKTLAQTQGTQNVDTWNRASDDCPVTFQVVTDIQYDTGTYQLTFRTRAVTLDRGGNVTAIGAESSPFVITTAETC